jgi:2-oxoisovalerate dehydrogenase E1 component
MSSQVKVKTSRFDASKYHGLDRDTLVRLYRTMFLSRRLDDREIQLKRQNRTYFQISGAGHEAVLVAAGLLLKPGYDWFFPYYRDRALALMLGVTPYEMLLQAVGAKDDPASGGRQMPSHWGSRRLNIIPSASATGMQWLHAVGSAEASLYYEHHPKALDEARKAPLGDSVNCHRDEIAYVSGGDGSTSEGEFFEALNAASLRRVPVLFLVEDNGYAISVPVEAQTAGGSISKLVGNFPHLPVEECDGTDPLASYAALDRAVAHCRARLGPALVHAHVTRPYSHSLSDDEKLYKTPEERDAEARRDPVPNFGLFLVREGILDETEMEAIEGRSSAKYWTPPTAPSPPSRPRRTPFMSACIRRTSIPPENSSRPRRSLPARRKPWSKWFPRRSRTRWPATSASSFSEKTWPTAPAKSLSPR